MILSKAPVLEDVHVVCDWLEFSALCSESSAYSFASLQREWDVHRNYEDTDPEGDNSTEDAFIENVKSEILERHKLLDISYPFELNESGESLKRSDAVTFGGYAYLLCLFLSHPTAGIIFSGKKIPEIDNTVRNYFQAISTIASSAEVIGNAYSFGFPRPDKSGFLTKLSQIYEHFGENTAVVTAIPAGASSSPKDEQIDVIAWSEAKDGAAGKYYLLGQVASGANWNSKSIKGGPIDSFHMLWFTRQPASASIASIWVPICMGNFIDDSSKDKVNAESYEFGHIFYRFRIPILADQGLGLVETQTGLIIEQIETIPNILKDWIEKQIDSLRLLNSHAIYN